MSCVCIIKTWIFLGAHIYSETWTYLLVLVSQWLFVVMSFLFAQRSVNSCREAELATGMMFPALGDLLMGLRYSNTEEMAPPDRVCWVGNMARDVLLSRQARGLWAGLGQLEGTHRELWEDCDTSWLWLLCGFVHSLCRKPQGISVWYCFHHSIFHLHFCSIEWKWGFLRRLGWQQGIIHSNSQSCLWNLCPRDLAGCVEKGGCVKAVHNGAWRDPGFWKPSPLHSLPRGARG